MHFIRQENNSIGEVINNLIELDFMIKIKHENKRHIEFMINPLIIYNYRKEKFKNVVSLWYTLKENNEA